MTYNCAKYDTILDVKWGQWEIRCCILRDIMLLLFAISIYWQQIMLLTVTHPPVAVFIILNKMCTNYITWYFVIIGSEFGTKPLPDAMMTYFPVTRNLCCQSARGNQSGAIRYFPEAVRPPPQTDSRGLTDNTSFWWQGLIPIITW